MFVIPTHDLPEEDVLSFDIQPLELSSGHDSGTPHRHSYYAVFFFEKGNGFHFIDFEDFPIRSKSIHFVMPGQVHMVRRQAGSYGHVMLFSEDFLHIQAKMNMVEFDFSLGDRISQMTILNLNTADFTRLYSLFLEIKKEWLGGDYLKGQLIRGWLNVMLLQCCRLDESQRNPSHRAHLSGSTLDRLLKLIELHFMKQHQPKWYAEQLSVTEKHLSGLVKKNTGETLSEKIQKRLLLEAKRYLLHSELSFKEIGWELNFEDPSYFTRFFKRESGLTPSQFRDQIRKKYHL